MTTSEALQDFFEGCKTIYLNYMVVHFPNNPLEEFKMQIGKRYAKIIRGSSVHVFVDMSNGDVLKAASWSAPAKGARGNIFDANNGLKRITPYGAEYNK